MEHLRHESDEDMKGPRHETDEPVKALSDKKRTVKRIEPLTTFGGKPGKGARHSAEKQRCIGALQKPLLY